MKRDFQVSGANLRGMDSNSLLRAYDQARSESRGAPEMLERRRATKALERLEAELKRRNVTVDDAGCTA